MALESELILRVKVLGREEDDSKEYNAVTKMELGFLMESRNGAPAGEISRSDEIHLFLGSSRCSGAIQP
jgi:hypothetical protein